MEIEIPNQVPPSYNFPYLGIKRIISGYAQGKALFIPGTKELLLPEIHYVAQPVMVLHTILCLTSDI